jgi:RNA-directed DNA polymerase
VDADLSDYFNTIPHGVLMQCVKRRIADGTVLSTIKRWLTATVCEHTRRSMVCSTEARDTSRGTPQGGVISPLLANLYFQRFLLAWHGHGYRKQLDAHVVNYADDLVICCRPGNGAAALAAMRQLMGRLGLTVNDRKTRIALLPQESFDFLGYTIGRIYGRAGRAFIGTRPSRKSLRRILKKVHAATAPQWSADTTGNRVAALNALLRGWAGYFDQGPVIRYYRMIQRYSERRLRKWLIQREGGRNTGYRRYPDELLHTKLRLFTFPESRAAVTNAKA